MDYEAKMKARAAAAAALAAANPWLVPVSSVKGGALIAAAKNIRIELARAFPGVKFSIKSRRFGMGDAIDVSWTDGPNSRRVDEIIDRYSAGSFDGMQDLYTYERSAWTDAFGDAKYVHARRELSDAMIASCARLVMNRYGLEPMSPDEVVKAYRSGALRSVRNVGNGYYDLSDLIYQESARRTCALNRAPKAVPMAEESEVA